MDLGGQSLYNTKRMSLTTLRRRFTVEEYYRMAESGILTANDRVELVEGEIIQMSPIGRRHASYVDCLNQQLVMAICKRAIVRVQNPLRIGDRSEPQPDLMLLAPKSDFYASGHPGPPDVFLLIEVADQSSDSVLEAKLRLYARSRISEVWVVNLEKRQIETYLDPEGEEYRSIRNFPGGTSVSPSAFDDIKVSIDQLP